MSIDKYGVAGLPGPTGPDDRAPLSDSVAPAKSPPPVLSDSPDLTGLIHGLRRRWAFALIGGLLLGATCAAVTWFVMPVSRYKATAILHVKSDPPRILPNSNPSEGSVDFRTYQRTQEMMIRSRTVVEGALRQADVRGLPSVRSQPDPVDWFQKRIEVEFVGEALMLSLSGDHPGDLAALVNAIRDSYLREVVNKERAVRQARYELLKQIASGYQKRLKIHREKLKALADEAGTNDRRTLTLRHQLELDRRQMVERELHAMRSQVMSAKTELETSQARAEARARAEAARRGIQEADVDRLVDQDDRVRALLGRRAKSEASYDRASRLSRNPGDPAVVAAHRELNRVDALLQSLRLEVRQQVLDQQRQQAAGGDDPELAALKRQVEVLQGYEKVLQEESDRLAQQTDRMGRNQAELESLQDSIRYADEAAQKVSAQVEELDVELMAPSRVTAFEDAVPPRSRSEKQRIVATAAAGGGSFLLLVLGVSWMEYRTRRVRCADEIVAGLGMELVGTIPALPARARGRRTALPDQGREEWQNFYLESIDATRLMLLHRSQRESLRVVMITSATNGEGKTSLTCCLGGSLSHALTKTLIVDCDLRRPSVHRVFDEPVKPGLSEVLRGEADVTDMIRPTPIPGLFILTAGDCGERPAFHNGRGGLTAVLNDLRNGFDFILIDSAPVLPVADSLIVGQEADAVLFSVLNDVSRLPCIYAARERLSMLGVRILGAVLSGTPRQSLGYDHRYSS
jgi:capsular exopolysaccharide synthesis family protein